MLTLPYLHFCGEVAEDQAELQDRCVVAEVRGGGVVEQGLYPAATHCHPVFRAEWARLLSLRWGQQVISS